MAVKIETTLDEYFCMVMDEIERAKKHGVRGSNMAHRVEGDLRRIMNSAWLNLVEYSSDQEEKNK